MADMDMRKPLIWLPTVTALVTVLILAACAARPVGEAGTPGDLTTLPTVADTLEAAPRVVAAFMVRDRLGVAVSAGSGTGYAVVTVPAVAYESVAAAGNGGTTARLEVMAAAPFEALRTDGVAIEVRGPQAWQALLGATLEQLAPLEDGRGAMIDFLHQHELFLYRDAAGTVLAVPGVYKPAEIEVAQSHDFMQLLAVMGRQLPERPAADNRLLFDTGDDSDYGYPFVYADGASGIIIFLQHAPPGPGADQGLSLGSAVGLFSRTLMDHVRAALNQPVSSVARLFTLAVTSTVDLAQPHSFMLVGQQPVPPLSQGPGMDLVAWEQSLDALTGSEQSAGQVKYWVDGTGFFPRLIDLISAARESVHLRVYIFDNDDYALRIADLLKRRSADIEVKVLVDGLGTFGASQVQAASLPPDYRPPLSMVNHLRANSSVKVRVLSNPWLTGDHTKAIVIDGATAFLGGMNIGREYRYDWHDMMVEASGPVVAQIVEDFQHAWARAGLFGDLQGLFPRKQATSATVTSADHPLRLLYTRPGNSQILRAQIAAIRNARQRIYLENPYLTSDAVLYELTQARRRGVDVRVIMPYRSDSGVINKSNALAANTLLNHGVRVFIYPGMSHLKAALYDGWACVGSANFDNLSLRVNREMNLATSHEPAVMALLEQVFRPDFERSLELTEPLPNDWSHFLAELLADSL
jgi:cardiolipin synthase